MFKTRDRQRRGAAVEPPGQIARSTVTNLATYADGSSLSPPSSVLRLHLRCRVLSGLFACSGVAVEFQQLNLLVGIA